MAEPRSSRSVLSTAEGTHQGDFGPSEWGLLAAAAGIWGSSFLFIAIGLDHFEPGLVTWLRILFGALGIGLARASHQPVDREDWPRLFAIGVLWIAIPFTLFPLAQRTIDSSLAGMLNGAMPLLTAAVASVLLWRRPARRSVIGLAIGFVGVLAISIPSLSGADASPVGVALGLGAVMCYAIALNLAVPMQQKYGSLTVLLRVLLVAAVLTAPYGLWSIGGSTFDWGALAAIVVLGFFGTGVAFVAMTTLTGRVGATRSSVAIYFTPIVAIVLGVVFRDEDVALLAIAGTALVLVGAWITSRGTAAAVDSDTAAMPSGDATAMPPAEADGGA
jgi:drug/metabolite transporter (DMT)-like permease